MIVDEGKYYLYRHIRLDKNEVFYIGIGTKNDRDLKYGYYTRAYFKKGKSKYWGNVTAKTDYRVEILLESNSHDFIKKKEKEFIKLYGRKDFALGTLVNLTDGGDGSVFSEERKKIISDSLKIRKRDYAFKPILIFDLSLNLLIEVKNSKEASKFIYGSDKYYKQISINCKFGFKTNKLFFVIKKEDYENNKINFVINKKKGKPSRGNCKSFYYNNKFYETKSDLAKELNLIRYRFDKFFKELIKQNKIKKQI